MKIDIACSEWKEHELLDSGDRKKLERFGSRIVVRSEPKAWWKKSLPEREWEKADAVNDDGDAWHIKRNDVPREWLLEFGKIKFQARFTDMSKHLGVFPEQAPHWEWMTQKAEKQKGRNMKMLNLFGYTGAATLVAASAGLSVTHVDASKPSVSWARKNQESSGLEKAPVRWILDDALKFVKREIRRNSRYDAIVMDPPSFGRGPDGEIWKAEETLPEFLSCCAQILSDKPIFIILTMYNIGASAVMLANLLGDMTKKHGGIVTAGELALKQKSSEKLLPLSIYSRWESN